LFFKPTNFASQRGKFAFYHVKHTTALCGQSKEFLYVDVGGISIYHCVFNVYK